MSYDFKSLSSADFEELTRDLLQAELGFRLESFKAGKDGGIDLRYSKDEEDTLIVQCKHYSDFNALLQTLKREVPKVKRLNPKRYILSTSIGCSPQQKDQIKNLFSPYIKSTTDDIYCQADINNLLGKHPKIEKQHFKLWLTSTEVLQKVVHSSIFNQSQAETDNIRHKAKVYVHNVSFFEAEKILNDEHYCIIAGSPGIGKTTLAEVLMIHYLNQDYEIVKISNDIDEAFSYYKPEAKQIFYYDDFLGQTSFREKLNKNEDHRLLRFIEVVKRSKSARLILTTREYILNQAKTNYEKLETSGFDIQKCIIDLSSYTFSDKARILFNHFYFSSIPHELVEQLISSQQYLKIIEHPNYSPRIIEWMTTTIRVNQIPRNKYPELFLENLNNPEKVWDHAFENQIARSSQYLLLCMATLSTFTTLNHLEEAFLKVYETDAKKYSFEVNPNDFKRALKELDGSFIKTTISRFVEFHDPSIRDYLKRNLKSNIGRVKSILNSIVFWEQLVFVRLLLDNNRNLPSDFKNALKSFIDTYLSQEKMFVLHSPEGVLVTVLEWQIQLQEDFGEIINKLFKKVDERIQAKVANKQRLVELLVAFKNNNEFAHYFNEDLLMNVKEFLIANMYGLDDVEYLVDFHKQFPNTISETEFTHFKNFFMEFSYEHTEDLMTDSSQGLDSLASLLYAIQNLSDYFGIAPSNLDALESLVDELEEQKADENDKEDHPTWKEARNIDNDNIASLFELLMDKGEQDNM